MAADLLALRALAEALHPGAAVPVPREWLLELLDGAGATRQALPPVDPTVEELAARYGRSPSTVRGWCEDKRFPGAYKQNDREWRIPSAAIQAFEAAERQRPVRMARKRSPDLSDWRKAS